MKAESLGANLAETLGDPGSGVDLILWGPGRGQDLALGDLGRGLDLALGDPGRGLDLAISAAEVDLVGVSKEDEGGCTLLVTWFSQVA